MVKTDVSLSHEGVMDSLSARTGLMRKNVYKKQETITTALPITFHFH